MKETKEIPYKDSATFTEQYALKIDPELKSQIRTLKQVYSIDTATLVRKAIKDAVQFVLKKIEGSET